MATQNVTTAQYARRIAQCGAICALRDGILSAIRALADPTFSDVTFELTGKQYKISWEHLPDGDRTSKFSFIERRALLAPYHAVLKLSADTKITWCGHEVFSQDGITTDYRALEALPPVLMEVLSHLLAAQKQALAKNSLSIIARVTISMDEIPAEILHTLRES